MISDHAIDTICGTIVIVVFLWLAFKGRRS
jgi:hypothetical protein